MTRLHDDSATFSEEMLVGFLDANADYVTEVPGGVVRRRPPREGKVAVVVGGGAGHYPAFCGVVGPGFADGAVVGNIFTSPSAPEAASVARAASSGAGVLLTTGNYAGDVMSFGLAVGELEAEGIPARYLAVTRHRQRRNRRDHQAARDGQGPRGQQPGGAGGKRARRWSGWRAASRRRAVGREGGWLPFTKTLESGVADGTPWFHAWDAAAAVAQQAADATAEMRPKVGRARSTG